MIERNLMQVFSYGGGVQSTAIASLIIKGRLPRPDLIVIVDTGFECSSTWQYMEAVVVPALSKINLQIHRIPNLFKRCMPGQPYISRSGTILLGGWGNQTPTINKFKGYCLSEWKKVQITNWLSRNQNLTRSKYITWIGFSLDEPRRAHRMLASREGAKGLIRFPLLLDYPLTRLGCLETIEKMGWPTAPRSRCFMCPNQGELEWLDVKQNFPQEFDQAIEIEKNIQKYDPCFWLHRSCQPLEKVVFNIKTSLSDMGLFCDSGNCFL